MRSPGCGKTLHADPESAHSRGYAPDFSCYGVAPEGQLFERHVHAGDARAGRDYGASLGTKPIPASSGLFAGPNVTAEQMSSRVSAGTV